MGDGPEQAERRNKLYDVIFPRAEASVESTIPKQKGSSDHDGLGRGTETILLVEDQQGIREVVQEFLKRRGYSVLCAADGDEALQIAGNHMQPIHMLLTDVVMPNMGGAELVEQLRRTLTPHQGIVHFSVIRIRHRSASAWVRRQCSSWQKPFPARQFAAEGSRRFGSVELTRGRGPQMAV